MWTTFQNMAPTVQHHNAHYMWLPLETQKAFYQFFHTCTVCSPRQYKHAIMCKIGWSFPLTPPAPVELLRGQQVRLKSHWAASMCECVNVIRVFLMKRSLLSVNMNTSLNTKQNLNWIPTETSGSVNPCFDMATPLPGPKSISCTRSSFRLLYLFIFSEPRALLELELLLDSSVVARQCFILTIWPRPGLPPHRNMLVSVTNVLPGNTARTSTPSGYADTSKTHT